MGKRRVGDVLQSALAGPSATSPTITASPPRRRRWMWPGLAALALLGGLAAALYLRVFSRTHVDDPMSFTTIEPADRESGCDTVDACRARCDAHHTPACYELVRLREPQLKFPERERAACDAGVGDGCAKYAMHLDFQRPGLNNHSEESDSYRARANQLDRTHCDAGDALSCWDLGAQETRTHSLECTTCYEAYSKACALGLLIGCSWAIRSTALAEQQDAAWRTGIGIVLGTCERERGHDLPCSRAIAEMTVSSFRPPEHEEARVTRARAVLSERLAAALASRCPASVDACVGRAVLDDTGMAEREKAHDRVQHVIELLSRGCNAQGRPDHCLGLAYIFGGRGAGESEGLNAFGEYYSSERARRAGLRACGLARSRGHYLGWPLECDFIFDRMKPEEVAEALKQDEYTQ